MNKNAYSQFSEITPSDLLFVFKTEFRAIPKDSRKISLNQGYQALARHVHCKSLESLKAQPTILVKVHEFIDALQECGLEEPFPNHTRYAGMLGCDVFCPRLNGALCLAIFNDDGTVVKHPFRSQPSPYIAGTEMYYLEVDVEGAWISNGEWNKFVNKLKDRLDLDGDIQTQINELWSEVDISDWGLYFDINPDNYEAMHLWSEGHFRQFILKNSMYTHADLLYDYFDRERNSQTV